MRTAFASLVSGLAAAACAGVSTSFDWDRSYDFARLSSYAWAEQDEEGGMSEPVLRRLRLAVADELSARGFVETSPERADFLIAYHAGVQDRQRYDTYGYGAGNWWGGYWGGGLTTTTVHTYTEDTLILDVVDRESNQLVWRGSTSRTKVAQETADARAATVEKAARRMLDGFPPD